MSAAPPVRPRRESRRPIRSILASVLLLLVCLAALGAIFSGRFRVRQVVVVGAHLPQQAIVEAAGVEGSNIFAVRSDQVIGRLGVVREIAVGRVETDFPDRVTIYAHRRPAMAAWRRGTALYLLDPDGHIIEQVRATTLPIITSTDGGDSLPPSILQAVREAVLIVPAAPNGAIAAFQYDQRGGLSIRGRAGWQALVGTGTPQTLVNRIATLAAFLQKTTDRQQPLKVVDLRSRVPYATYG